MHEEEKGTPELVSQKSALAINIGQKIDEYAHNLGAVAAQYATIKGLQNLGSTRRRSG